ncbi:MAG: aminopeptidase P family protein [Acetobacteraceae bacterium]|nr:aminopeptidase P family protein [Acetobacteraceae bacterium]
MPFHFPRAEYDSRIARAAAELTARKLDGALLFAPESHYWLTGYDTFGFCFFQCLYLGADGRLALLTRSADLRQARHTSIIEDIRVWTDSADASPGEQLRAMLESLGARRTRLGIETATQGLTHANGRAVHQALRDFCGLITFDGVIEALRAVKSEAELACVRRAAELADDALDAATELVGPGADEGGILAAMQGAVFKGGGDYPGNEFIIGSGSDALLCRYKSGRRRLDAEDQITLEFAGSFRRYHSALMRTLCVGRATPRHRALHAACHDALLACEAELRPGRTAGDVFAAHARVLDAAGLAEHRLNACGYSLGARFTPSWMDPPMCYAANPFVLVPNMVMFLHMIVMDSSSGTAMTLGRTSVITGAGSDVLSRHDIRLLVF